MILYRNAVIGFMDFLKDGSKKLMSCRRVADERQELFRIVLD